jgi:Cu(I)/Ag(I) efflux system membrane protein CusA/SilA
MAQGTGRGDDTMAGGGDSMPSTSSPAAAAGMIHVPLGQLASIRIVNGPPMIKDEDGSLVGWVYVDVEGSDLAGYVQAAKAAVHQKLRLPAGYRLQWTGQYEFMERVAKRLQVVIPLTLLIIFVILYMNLRSLPGALLVMCSVPFAAVGSIWLMWAAQFNTSIAVWVGMIALLGIAAETASVMVVYLEEGYTAARDAGRLASKQDLLTAAGNAATLRVRPLLMTVIMNILGLLPVMLDTGVGSDVAKRIAAPMWGGLVSLTLPRCSSSPCCTCSGASAASPEWRLQHQLRLPTHESRGFSVLDCIDLTVNGPAREVRHGPLVDRRANVGRFSRGGGVGRLRQRGSRRCTAR